MKPESVVKPTRRSGRPADRLAEGLEEQRADLGLSRRQLGELAGFSYWTVREVEQGRNRCPRTIVRLRTTLAIVELYGQPAEPLALMPPAELRVAS